MADEKLALGETIRTACQKAAAEAYEDACVSGLCDEGGIERALDAIRSLELERIVADFESQWDNRITGGY